MKNQFKQLFLSLTGILLATAIVTSIVSAADVGLITKEELKPSIDNDGVIILDVRRGRDWSSSEFKIKGAFRASPGDFEQWSGNYSKDKKLVLYCA